MRATLLYFDAAHLLKNAQTTLVTEIGFIDKTCPATSVVQYDKEGKLDHTATFFSDEVSDEVSDVDQ